MIDFVDKIVQAIEQGKFSVGIFLDLSKAFDTINHNILIRKLEHYGIRGVAKKWFENYLCDRKQIVKYNEVHSEEMKIFRPKNKKTKHDLKFQINNNFIKQ